MSLKTTFYMGLRPFLWKKYGVRGVIRNTVLAVGLAMVPLVIVLIVSDGMIEGIISRFIETKIYHFRVVPPRNSEPDEIREVVEKINGLSWVTSAETEVQGGGIAFTREVKEGVLIRGLNPSLLEKDEKMNSYFNFLKGSWSLDDSGSVLLGSAIAEKLEAEEGDTIRLLTGKVMKGKKLVPRITRVKVKGVFTTGYQELDKNWVIIPESLSEKIIGEDEMIRFIGIKTMDPFLNQRENYRALKNILPKSWRVQTWEQIGGSSFALYSTTKLMLILIMGLIVVVAGINISSSLIMLVLEKREDIAILKSMGLSPKEVRNSYLVTGVTIGFIGAFLGLCTGLLISVNINEIIAGVEGLINIFINIMNFIKSLFTEDQIRDFHLLDTAHYLDHIPINVNFSEVLLAGLFTVAVTGFASYIPARKAGSIRPLEIMQKH